jgi:hypothetical protein
MKHIVSLTALVVVLLGSSMQAAVVTREFTGTLNSTTLNFLSLSPAPSSPTPRPFVLSISFNDIGIATGTLAVGGSTVDTFGAASGWSINDAGASDLLTVTLQSGVNATKFHQFSLPGGNVTSVATNSLTVLDALLPTTSASPYAIGNIGSGALGYAGTIAASPIPEPASLSLLAAAGLLCVRRRRSH